MLKFAGFAVQAAALLAAAYMLVTVFMVVARAFAGAFERTGRRLLGGLMADAAEYKEFRSNVLAAFDGRKNRMVYVEDEQVDWAMRMVSEGDVRWAPPLGGQRAIMLSIGWTGGAGAPRAPELKKPDLARGQFLDALRRSTLVSGRWAADALSAVPGGPAEMWAGCPRGDVLLWLASWADVDRRPIVAAVCAAVRPVLGYVPISEDRPKTAIETAEAWAGRKEGVTVASVEEAGKAAYAARCALRASVRSSPSAMAAAEAAQYVALVALRDPAAVDAVDAVYAAADAASADPILAAGLTGVADAPVRGLVRTSYMAFVADVVRKQIPWSVVEAALRKQVMA